MQIVKFIVGALIAVAILNALGFCESPPHTRTPKAAKSTSKVFLACESEEVWDALFNAQRAGHDAFANKVNQHIAANLCAWVPKNAKCIVTDLGVFAGVDEVYVNDIGPVYVQNARAKGCTRR